jgi:heme-degrading monooxygenase HmoA
MFIAMNCFKVIKEERKAFEDLWVTRQSRLDEVKGFRAFHLLRGPERDDHVPGSSGSVALPLLSPAASSTTAATG